MLDQRIDRLGEMMERMFRSMQRLLEGGECPESELPKGQYLLLSWLDVHGPCSIGELQRMGAVAQSTISETVARLARVGCVRKKPDPEDRRTVHVAITAVGRAVLGERRRFMREHHRAVLANLSDTDQQRFLEAFETLAALADKAAGNVTEQEDDHAK